MVVKTSNAVRRGPAGVSREAPPGILNRLRSVRNHLPTAMQTVADYILAHPKDIIRMAITEVAEACGVSDGSVVRLCQKLESKGFLDFKMALAYELIEPVQFIHEDVQPGDSMAAVIEKVFRSDMRALDDTLKILNPVSMAQAVDIILNAERVDFYGIGSSAPVALDAYYRMLRIGINCTVATDAHVQAVSAALSKQGVAVVTVSHTGSTRDTYEATRLAKEAGAKTICITSYGKNPILAYADVALHTLAPETMFRIDPMTSRIVELSIVDALYVGVALANLERATHSMAAASQALSLKRL